MGRNLTVFFILAFITVGSITVYNGGKLPPLTSPIPRIQNVFGVKVEEKKILNDWFPKLESSAPDDLGYTLSAKSAIVVDYDNGEVVYSKNPQEKLPVASVVKIMTALVALDEKKQSDIFTVSEKASKIGENSMILTEGEKLTLEELLYGMMLVSGNDAAVTIAENVAGTEEEFVRKMNEVVKNLGLLDTRFVNASGLDEDDKLQYSSAYDLAVISRYLWDKHPEIENYTATYHKYIEAKDSHKDFDLYNDTNLLTTYPGVKGIKPGFTWEAGLCLVTYAENDGKKLLAVILGSENRRMEMKELLDYGFGKFGIKVDHPALDF